MRDNRLKNLRKGALVALVATSAFAGNVGVGVARGAARTARSVQECAAPPRSPVRATTFRSATRRTAIQVCITARRKVARLPLGLANRRVEMAPGPGFPRRGC